MPVSLPAFFVSWRPKMLRQKTLRGPVQAIGIGLHSGQRVSLNIKPGPADSGIVFRRVDLDPPVDLPALAHRITDTRLNTTLSADTEGPGLEVAVHTIEHLMSALAGLGIDNAQIDITASEVPILDGSAGSFVYLLQSAGLEEQAAPKRFIRIKRPVQINDGDKWVRLDPYEGFKLSFEIAFGQAAIDATGQRIEIDFANTSYIQEIARARTFVMASEVELLRKHGLALGGSLDNAIVVDDDRVLNADGLRYRDEFAKTQGTRCHWRPVPDRSPHSGCLPCPQVRSPHEQPAGTCRAGQPRQLRDRHFHPAPERTAVFAGLGLKFPRSWNGMSLPAA